MFWPSPANSVITISPAIRSEDWNSRNGVVLTYSGSFLTDFSSSTLMVVRRFILYMVSISAEPVEKIQMANSDNFCTVKNQQLTDHRKPQNAQI